MAERIHSLVPTLQPLLADQIDRIQQRLLKLPALKAAPLVGVILFGSSAEGRATYRSDVDLLAIVTASRLTSTLSGEVRDFLEAHLAEKDKSGFALPVQATVVLDSVFETSEPEMLRTVREGIILFDPDGEIARRRSTIHQRKVK